MRRRLNLTPNDPCAIDLTIPDERAEAAFQAEYQTKIAIARAWLDSMDLACNNLGRRQDDKLTTLWENCEDAMDALAGFKYGPDYLVEDDLTDPYR